MVNHSRKNIPRSKLLGIGLDNTDEHTRITKGDNFYLHGGSEETHEHMVETTIKFNEKLDAKGKQLEDLAKNEFFDMMSESSQ
jgi:hypothetical protein